MRWQIEPLTTWPWPRTTDRKSSGRFTASWPDTITLLEREVENLGIRGALAVRAWCRPGDIRVDGVLRSNAQISEPGVVVSFTSRHGPLTYPCDTYAQIFKKDLPGWQANLRAIALSLEALRAVDRHGVAGRGEQYTGWRRITAGPSSLFATADEAIAWLISVVGDSPGARAARPGQLLTIVATLAHPDANGGDRTLWDRYDAARQLLERTSS